MKKLLAVLAVAGVAYYYFGRKTEAAEEASTTKDPLEGKIVVAPNGNWLYISGGKSFYVAAEAWPEYQKTNPGYVVPNIDELTFKNHPISGEFLAGQIIKNY